MNKIGIVGGADFIGSTLARHLSRSFMVKILDKKPIPKVLGEKLEYQQCDVRNYNEVKQGLENVELVINAADLQ